MTPVEKEEQENVLTALVAACPRPNRNQVEGWQRMFPRHARAIAEFAEVMEGWPCEPDPDERPDPEALDRILALCPPPYLWGEQTERPMGGSPHAGDPD